MFDLFRFVMLRPPAKTDDNGDAIKVEAQGGFGEQLREAASLPGVTALEKMKKICSDIISSGELVKSINLPHEEQFLSFYNGLLKESGPVSIQTLTQLIQKNFNTSAEEVAANTNFENEKQILHNAIIAIKISPLNIDSSLVERVVRNIYLIHLIERVANNDSSLNNNNIHSIFRGRMILLPDFFPLPAPVEFSKGSPEGSSSTGTTSEKEKKKVIREIEGLSRTLHILRTLDPEDFSVTSINTQLNASNLNNNTSNSNTEMEEGVSIEESLSTSLIQNNLFRIKQSLTIKQKTVDAFTDDIKSTLSDLKLDLTTVPVNSAIEKICSTLKELYVSSSKMYFPSVNLKNTSSNIISRIGNNFFPLAEIPDINDSGSSPHPWQTAHFPSLLHRHKITPIGIADLLVVKYHIKEYPLGEIAHVENILKGESTTHIVRRQDTVERSISTETQTTKEEERDLQTTERFDLKNETQNTIRAQGQLTSGLSASPSYGQVLEFQGDNTTPITGSQEVSQIQASSYSKEITTSAASKVSETVKQQVLMRTTHQFEEKTIHGFNNVGGQDHVKGIYQWIDKIYQAQIFSYGKRLMYDIMVPEPAAFLEYVLAKINPEGQYLVKPTEFNLRPDQINECNYMIYAQLYDAINIQPPPQPKILTEFYDFDKDAEDNIFKISKFSIPDGYCAFQASAISRSWIVTGVSPADKLEPRLQVLVGGAVVAEARTNTDTTVNVRHFFNVGLSKEERSVVVIVQGVKWLKLLLNIGIRCTPTTITYLNWQIQTHASIQQAYLNKLSEYEERLANLQMQLRSNIMGRSPEQNLKIIKTELKKAVISLFTYQQYESFNAIKVSKEGYPEIDFDKDPESQGDYVRFFERAIEWEQMTYMFYPYFWGRKENWPKRFLISDTDPNFTEFLKAGSSRVVVPVRPGFERALAHFMDTGEIWWIGGEIPGEAGSEESLNLIEEIREREGAPLNEIPYGEPWEVRLATTLVRVRDVNSDLPAWKEEPPRSGKWVPVE